VKKTRQNEERSGIPGAAFKLPLFPLSILTRDITNMKTRTFAAILFAAGILVGAGSSEIIHAQAPSIATRQIFRTDLNNLPGQEVLLFASTWQPGFRLPLHMHPEGHEITYVVEGEQTFEIDGVGTRIVKAGEAIYTPPNTPHFGRNATDGVSRTIVVRIKAKDQPVTVEVKR
jgi:quercetin dioxygenase-like cupin family protein